ncbi:MAG: helix-turn-helix domain-containing protein [Aquabacterium sp.]|nr:helix-turn-helix domain-containing protein [Aquabacterium sp.]
MKPLQPDAVALGLRLATARQQAGLNGESVGVQLGYKGGKKTVSQWETGRAVPDSLTLRHLCRLYQCSADTLLWADAAESPAGRPPLSPATLRRIAQLDQTRRASLEAALSHMLDAVEPQTPRAVSTADFAGKPPQHAAAPDPITTPAFLKR